MGTKSLVIRFDEKTFKKLENVKELYSGAMFNKGKGRQSWEDFILHMCL